jgi:hypothetical protein
MAQWAAGATCRIFPGRLVWLTIIAFYAQMGDVNMGDLIAPIESRMANIS